MSVCTLWIVDDNEAMASVLAETAGALGFEVTLATTARAFQRLLDEGQPDVIMLDMVIPDMTGIEVIQRLATVEFRGQLVLMSGYETMYLTSASRLANARKLRVAGQLHKPFRLDQVEDVLRPLLAGCVTAKAGTPG